jgi:PAS domain S-box-containing protein
MPDMNGEAWNLWKQPQLRMSESRLLRYGLALALPSLAAVLTSMRPAFHETPYFLFLAAVVLSATNGGVAAGFQSTALSAVLIRLFFVHQAGLLRYANDSGGIERMGGFLLLGLLLSSFVASLRGERNQLRDSEERYRILAESASDAIIVIDERGEILYINPVAERVFGARAQDLLGKNVNLLLPGDRYQSQLNEIHHHLDTRKKPVVMQLPALHQSGERLLVEMTLGVSSHRGKNLFTAIIRDITAPTR